MKTKKSSWKQLPSGVHCRTVNGRVEVLTPEEYLRYSHLKWWKRVLLKYFI
tara:strand:+ start:2447 stop:2599 length:153 start_codon:yes stop_codon:yes gene_type:complete